MPIITLGSADRLIRFFKRRPGETPVDRLLPKDFERRRNVDSGLSLFKSVGSDFTEWREKAPSYLLWGIALYRQDLNSEYKPIFTEEQGDTPGHVLLRCIMCNCESNQNCRPTAGDCPYSGPFILGEQNRYTRLSFIVIQQAITKDAISRLIQEATLSELILHSFEVDFKP